MRFSCVQARDADVQTIVMIQCADQRTLGAVGNGKDTTLTSRGGSPIGGSPGALPSGVAPESSPLQF